MATYATSDLNTKPRLMGEWGDFTPYFGKVTPTANIATADKIRWCRIPAGAEISAIIGAWASQGTTVPVDIGYEPVDSNEGSLAASTNYFKATLAMGTASADGTVFAGFDPIKFEQDVYLTGTVGTVTAGGAAVSRFSALGTVKGPK